MGDALYSAPDLQSIRDTQKPETMGLNLVGQNLTNVDEHRASSIEKENLLGLPSSEARGFPSSKLTSEIPPQQNGDHVGLEEGDIHSEIFKQERESESAQTDVSSLDEDGNISLNPREEDSNGAESRDSSPLPKNPQEGMQELCTEEVGTEGPANASHSNKTQELSSNLGIHTGIECPAVSQGRALCLSDNSNAVWVGDTMEDGDAVFVNNSIEYALRREALSDSEKIEEICLEEKDGVGDESLTCIDNSIEYALRREAFSDSEKIEEIYLEEKDGVGDESRTGTTPCISSDILTESSSKNNVQPPLVPTANESIEHKDEVADGGDFQALPSLTRTGESEVPIIFQSEVDQSLDMRKQEWSDQNSVATSLISNDLEGWQRFDAEEVITNMDHSHGTDQRLEMWEKLLDDGLDGIDRHAQNSPLQLTLAPQVALAPPYEDSQFGFASPGNPFIEGLGRVSSFSEADGFVRNGDFPSSARLSQSFEEPSSFLWKEAPFHAVGGIGDFSSGIATVEGEKNSVQLESVNEHRSKSHLHSKPLSSFDSMEPFEAPSFMSLVDPKSQALFEASMPTYQASSTGYGQEIGGEKWEANFDLMAPSTQEITRSVSLPRSGSEDLGQRPGQSFSFATNREEEPSKTERSKSGLFSPKLSPLMQKVVNKVRTTPAVANGVLNTVRQAVSPKASDKTSSSKSMLACCVCW